MLVAAGPDVYDMWVAHKIPFNDARVVEALDKVGAILRDPRYVNGGYGGVQSIATVAMSEDGLPILQNTCAMHRQASFYANEWPDGTKIGPDGDVYAFYLPTLDTTRARPILGAGEFVGAFDTPRRGAGRRLVPVHAPVGERSSTARRGGQRQQGHQP